MSATAIPEDESFADALRQAAPLAEELLEMCNNQRIGVIILAMMVAQLSLVEDYDITKKEFDGMLNSVWSQWNRYKAEKHAAH
mgnify:CR=1 FL=1